ncbi:MAG: hypothetical protein AB2816_20055, partial [Candidatus Thiodiazotropha endolucinida]
MRALLINLISLTLIFFRYDQFFIEAHALNGVAWSLIHPLPPAATLVGPANTLSAPSNRGKGAAAIKLPVHYSTQIF